MERNYLIQLKIMVNYGYSSECFESNCIDGI